MGIVRIPLRLSKTLILDEEDAERFAGKTFVLHQSKPASTLWYVRIQVGTGQRYLHRLITGAERGQVVDHIDGDGLNNTRVNLRFVGYGENNQKVRRPRIDNTSGFVGVHYVANKRRWIATAQIDKKSSYLGMYDSPVRAARAYDAFVRRERGPFAFVNFPEEAA